VLKKKCAAIETVIQYKAGAGGGLLWSQMNTLPPTASTSSASTCRTWCCSRWKARSRTRPRMSRRCSGSTTRPTCSSSATRARSRTSPTSSRPRRPIPAKINLGGSGLNSANHAAHERLNQRFGIKTTYVPYKGTGDLSLAVLGNHINGAMTYTPFAIANKDKVRPLAVAMEARHPLLPDVPTFKELGVDWVDGAYRGIGVPKATPADARKRLSDLFASLNADPQMKELAAKAGFELVNVGLDDMDNFMRTRTKVYTDVGKRMGLGGAK
jgi:tripartite-type tricarboxylate transporter receptor subunit TctC